MKLLKFGGTSVATPERIRHLGDILKQLYIDGENIAVVVSAFGGVTNLLVRMSEKAAAGDISYKEELSTFVHRHENVFQELIDAPLNDMLRKELRANHESLENLLYGIYLVREVSPRVKDHVLSFGERNSAYIIAHGLLQMGLKSAYLDARKVVQTDCNFGMARVNFEKSNHLIQSYFQANPEMQIITGFIGSTLNGITSTLGRGGSDYTAAIFGAALDAEEIQIWTDVDGVLTANPKKVGKAFTIPELTYAEAMEFSHFGAKVIYPPTIQPALQKNIPIRIKNTFSPSNGGTKIIKERKGNGHIVSGISSIENVSLLTLQGTGLFGVPGTAARLFGALAVEQVNVIMITQGSSEHAISFAVDPADARIAKTLVDEAFELEIERNLVEPVVVEWDLSIIAIIGENMRYRPGISGRLFQALGKNGINVVAVAQGSSELNISVCVSKEDEIKAINALHESFFLSDYKVVHLFMVGVGLVGKELLEQMDIAEAFLSEKHKLRLKIVGLANSKKMIFNVDGIATTNYAVKLEQGGEDMDIAGFCEAMIGMNLPNSIFVDNTATEKIPRFYEKILAASISVSTPNKVAASSEYVFYDRLKNLAKRHNILFKYETNVGAGLPILTTLNDLIVSGDKIRKIQGVLSGSLSFIFNTFMMGGTFADAIKEAKLRGYTEPDPRDDLSGRDVCRKLVILARDSGVEMEQSDVLIGPVLREVTLAAEGIEAFFDALSVDNEDYENYRAECKKNNTLLRCIGTIEEGRASLRVMPVSEDSPFYKLSGSDNMVVFTTDRYNERPLVVQGPGAGAGVTAAGVFAEIISISNNV